MQNNLRHQSEYSTILRSLSALYILLDLIVITFLTKNMNHTALEIDLYILYTQ